MRMFIITLISLFILSACAPTKDDFNTRSVGGDGSGGGGGGSGGSPTDPNNCKPGYACKPTGDKVNRTLYKNCNKETPAFLTPINRWKVVYEYRSGIFVETTLQIAETNVTLTSVCKRGNNLTLTTWVNVPSEISNGKLVTQRSESRSIEGHLQDGSIVTCPAAIQAEIKSLTLKGECLQISDADGRNPVLYTLGN